MDKYASIPLFVFIDHRFDEQFFGYGRGRGPPGIQRIEREFPIYVQIHS